MAKDDGPDGLTGKNSGEQPSVQMITTGTRNMFLRQLDDVCSGAGWPSARTALQWLQRTLGISAAEETEPQPLR